MNSSESTTRERLPEFTLTATDYGWTGSFPGGPHTVFAKEIQLEIHTREVPDEPELLPPVSVRQAALVRRITPGLPAILKRVEEAMVEHNDHDPDFRRFVTNPHVWLACDQDNGESWTFVIERTDNPDYGYHTEFEGTNFVEIWSGD